MKNILTFDIEDWYHTSLVNSEISQWNQFEDRVVQPTLKIMDMLLQTKNKATFFVLGYIAQRFPELVLKMKKDGHEIASHGYYHQIVYYMNKREFIDDLIQSKEVIENIIQDEIIGYRAPSWSLNQTTDWVWDILYKNGFKYDSSRFPFKTFLYGSRSNPRFLNKIEIENNKEIIDIPPSVLDISGIRIPFCGGFYFRALPYWFIKYAIKRVNIKENQSVLMYFHPWELDAKQPKITKGIIYRFVQYYHLRQMENKLKQLLSEFQFISIKQHLTELGEYS